MEGSVYYALYSTHLGFYCSALLSLLFGVVHWRSVPRSRSTVVAQVALAAGFLLIGIAAIEPQLRCAWEDVRLWSAERRIRAIGPDTKMADFLERMGKRTLPMRARLVALCAPYLDGREPMKACAALEIFGTLRKCSTPPSGAKGNEESARFVADLDQLVLDSFSRWQLFRDRNGYRDISLYLSLMEPADSKPRLKEIARQVSSNGQALICIAWQRDPADMDFLMPFMLANSHAAASLPYHFRKSYGQAAIPYLERAEKEAQADATRKAAHKELQHLSAEPKPSSAEQRPRRPCAESGLLSDLPAATPPAPHPWRRRYSLLVRESLRGVGLGWLGDSCSLFLFKPMACISPESCPRWSPLRVGRQQRPRSKRKSPAPRR